MRTTNKWRHLTTTVEMTVVMIPIAAHAQMVSVPEVNKAGRGRVRSVSVKARFRNPAHPPNTRLAAQQPHKSSRRGKYGCYEVVGG